MTRLEAIQKIRRGERLIVVISAETNGIERDIEVWINYEESCSGFQARRRHEHQSIGPLHLRFWAVSMPDWLHINPKQLLGFIRRNYPRK